MAKINLLPWREEFRQEKKKEFQIQMFGVCALAVLIAFAWIKSVDGAIDNQKQRNRILQEKISVLDTKVAEIQELRRAREDLIARMRVIQDLQGTRPTIVRYFDEMVRAVPDGIFFNTLRKQGNTISIEGVTESSNRVSSFMRNLDDSAWFSNPNLRSIRANPSFGDQAAEFSLQLRAVLPADAADEGA